MWFSVLWTFTHVNFIVTILQTFLGLKSVLAFLHDPLHVTGDPVGVPEKAPSISAEPIQPFNRIGLLCTGCNKVLLKGQTAFQRSGSSKLFCSPACLCSSKTKTCHCCLKYAYDISFSCIVVCCWNELTWCTFFTFREICDQHNTVIGPVDMLGTLKEFCSQKCLSTLKFKCSVCQKTGMVSRLLQFDFNSQTCNLIWYHGDARLLYRYLNLASSK